MSIGAETLLKAEEKSSIHYPALLLSLCLPSFSLRLIQLFETESSLVLGDLRGFAADIIVVSIVVVLLLLVRLLLRPRLSGLIVVALTLFWCALTYGNYEHVKALGALSTWAYISFLLDPTFVSGSVFNATKPVIFWGLMFISFGLVVFSLSRSWSLSRYLSALLITLILANAVFFIIDDSVIPDWRKNNHFIHNLSWASSNEEIKPAAISIKGLFPHELQGSPRIELGRGNTNVLMIVLEGISGAYLDRVVKAHQINQSLPDLPQLDSFGGSSLVFSNFINHQRQTNRGLYSLLCGDIPRLKTSMPKMSEIGASRQHRSCLPDVLKNNGYRTVYMQSAPLAFMGKDKFMPKIGFEEVYGAGWFVEQQVETGKWGVNDQELFDHALDLIKKELLPKNQPWFMTLLTAGTHHPFMVPESFQGSEVSGSFAHAVEFLDQSLESLFIGLKDMKLSENTLIIVTSDESFGQGQVDEMNTVLMSQAFGSLTISTPAGETGLIHEPYLQMDIPVSVLDYLGLTEHAGELGGRSVFRHYRDARPLPFANTYLRMVAVIDSRNVLTSCHEDMSNCQSYQLSDEMIMSAGREKIMLSTESTELLDQILQRSFYSGLDLEKTNWALIETEKEIPLSSLDFDPVNERIKIFGSQYLSVSGNSSIKVEVDFDIIGEEVDVVVRQRLRAIRSDDLPSGSEYVYSMASTGEREESGIKGESGLGMRPDYDRKNLYKESWRRESAGPVRIAFKYSTLEPLDLINCTLDIINKGGSDISVKFRQARLSIEQKNDDEGEGLYVIAEPE